MIQLITRSNNQGYLTAYVLKQLFPKEEISIEYNNKATLSNDELEYDSEARLIVLLGIPFSNSQLTVAKERLISVANPFTTVVHIASFGDIAQINYVESIVDKEVSPLKVLVKLLKHQGQLTEVSDTVIETISEYVELADDYHRFDFSKVRLINQIEFNSFITHYGVYLLDIIGSRTVSELARDYHTELDVLKTNRLHYTKTRLRTARIKLVGNIVVALVYAEKYANEIADFLLENYSKSGNRVVALVGSKTKGDDLFRIRTRGIHAGEVAKCLNNGGGKENTASVFLGDTDDSRLNVIADRLVNL